MIVLSSSQRRALHGLTSGWRDSDITLDRLIPGDGSRGILVRRDRDGLVWAIQRDGTVVRIPMDHPTVAA